jgi:hypothetical protein
MKNISTNKEAIMLIIALFTFIFNGCEKKEDK